MSGITRHELSKKPAEEQLRILREAEEDIGRQDRGLPSLEAEKLGLGVREARLFDWLRNGSERARSVCNRIWPEAKGSVDQRVLNRLWKLQAAVNMKLKENDDSRRIWRLVRGVLALAKEEELPNLRKKWIERHTKREPNRQEINDLTMEAIHGLSDEKIDAILQEVLPEELRGPANNLSRQQKIEVLLGKPNSRQKRARRGKRSEVPPVVRCMQLLKDLLAQGINGSKELQEICCEKNECSSYAFIAAYRELNLRSIRRGYGKGGRWELRPE